MDGRPRKYNFREILNEIFYVEKTGCQWRQLPKDLQPWRSLYNYFREWSKSGIFERINRELTKRTRLLKGKNENATVGIIDSQSVKTTKKGAL
ncbi:MAG: transposase [Candidatus Dojkabacteria bacterium]|nr:transposase [Candidatus Dojkabacteria bacterium]